MEQEKEKRKYKRAEGEISTTQEAEEPHKFEMIKVLQQELGNILEQEDLEWK